MGCGNGWLSSHFAPRAGHGCWASTPACLKWSRPHASSPVLPSRWPKVGLASHRWVRRGGLRREYPVLADMQAVLDRAQELLAEGGQVHVLDSILYPDAPAASRPGPFEGLLYRHGPPGHGHALTTPIGCPDLLDRPGHRCCRVPTTWRLRRMAGLPVSPFTHVAIDKG